jgi:Cu/Ag efflux pump CusA
MVRQEGPVSIERQDQERLVRVSAGFANRDMGSIMRDIDTRLAELQLCRQASLSIMVLSMKSSSGRSRSFSSA